MKPTLRPSPPAMVVIMTLAIVVLAFLMLYPVLLQAAVPHEDAAPAYAEEQTILQIEKDQPEPGWTSPASGRRHFDRNYIVPPGNMPEQDVILQRGGNTWRLLRNGPLATLSGTVLILAPLLILLVWKLIGPAKTPPPSGRRIRRFSPWQRFAHWATAISFVLLAVTGVVLLFGKVIILPWLGHAAFSWLALASKYLHNVVGPLFILFSIALFLTFVKRNLFDRLDWRWLRKLGGLVGKEHPPSGFFNAGEKLWFWFGLTFLGLVMAATGLVLDFAYFGEVGSAVGSTRYLQQWASLIHLLAASGYIALAMGHAYIGTAGTPGTYEGMRHGTVDESWAQHHHPLWLEDVKAGRDGTPADEVVSQPRTRPVGHARPA
jgi:formate dehydrogenase subunit gamma